MGVIPEKKNQEDLLNNTKMDVEKGD